MEQRKSALGPRYRIARLRPAGLLFLMSTLALTIGSAPVAHANTITVNSLLDTPDPGKCRLRDAIIAANTNTAVDGCSAGAPGMDIINFSLLATCRLVQCSLLLASPLPAVSQDVTINGSPYGVLISGENLHVVFDLSGVVVNISNLTVANGNGDFGGGIIMDGTTLTLSNVRISGNHAVSGSGIYQPSGTLHVFNSSFLGNATEAGGFGGAIGQAGGAAVISSTIFSSNSGGSGGAIASLAISNLEVTDSVFDGNSAAIWGGAIYLQDDTVQASIAGSAFTNNQVLTSTAFYGGGAIRLTRGVLTLANSLLANNLSQGRGGALDISGGQATLSNVTVTGNTTKGSGGGLYVQNDGVNDLATVNLNNVTMTNNTADSDNDNTGDGGGLGALVGTITVVNSIIAANFDTPSNSGAGTIHPDCSGTFASPAYNLIGRDDGCLGFVNGSNGNLVGTAGSPLDPLLAPLADNGGSTSTHALAGGSPAVNAANPLAPGSGGLACAVTDQRGVIRPLGPRCDMGAYETGGRLFLPLIRR
jgi:predicted outer membrane repeat protein